MKGQDSFWGSVYLPLATLTPDLAKAIEATSRPVNLTLTGSQFVSDEVLRTLLKSRLNATLQDVAELTPAQISIVSEELANAALTSGGGSTRV